IVLGKEQLASPEGQIAEIVSHQILVAANCDDGNPLLDRSKRWQTHAAIGYHETRNVLHVQYRGIKRFGWRFDDPRSPIQALEDAEQVGSRDDLSRLPRFNHAPAFGPQSFTAHRGSVSGGHVEDRGEGVSQYRLDATPRIRPALAKVGSVEFDRVDVGRDAGRQSHSVVAVTAILEQLNQVGHAVNLAGHAARVGYAGLHEQALFQH